MQTTIIVAIGLALALAAFPAEAATRAPGKAAPACSAISFRPLPQGMPDGEQQAGMYKSRHGRLELRAEVKQGNPSDYYVTLCRQADRCRPVQPAGSRRDLRRGKEDAKTGNPRLVLYRPTV